MNIELWKEFMKEQYPTVGGKMVVDFVGDGSSGRILLGEELDKLLASLTTPLYKLQVGYPTVRNLCTLATSPDTLRYWQPSQIREAMYLLIGREQGEQFWVWYLANRSKYVDDLNSTLTVEELAIK